MRSHSQGHPARHLISRSASIIHESNTGTLNSTAHHTALASTPSRRNVLTRRHRHLHAPTYTPPTWKRRHLHAPHLETPPPTRPHLETPPLGNAATYTPPRGINTRTRFGCCEPPLPPQLKLIVPSLRGFVCSEALLVLFDEVGVRLRGWVHVRAGAVGECPTVVTTYSYCYALSPHVLLRDNRAHCRRWWCARGHLVVEVERP